MTRNLISFDDGARAHIPDDEWPAVGEAAHAVVREAKDAGVWIHGGLAKPYSTKQLCAAIAPWLQEAHDGILCHR